MSSNDNMAGEGAEESVTAQLQLIDASKMAAVNKKIFHRLIELNTKKVVIGRDADCDFTWGSMEVAKRHFQLEYFLTHWFLRALCTFGVFVNGKTAQKDTLVKLNNGDIIGFSITESVQYKVIYIVEPQSKPETTAGQAAGAGDGVDNSIVLQIMEDESCCAICNEIMIDATGIDSCGHTFCHYCINECFERLTPQCPICRKHFRNMWRQVQMQNLIDKLIETLPLEARRSREELLEERRKEVEAREGYDDDVEIIDVQVRPARLIIDIE